MKRLVSSLLFVAACSVPEKHAIDVDGGVDAAPTSDGYVDTGAPDTMIVEAPADFSNMAQATFKFTSDDPNATFTCSVDGDTPVPCVSPYTRSLSDGVHSFSVRAIDTSGNVDETPAEHPWTIDTIAPNTSITQAPPKADNSTTVTFEFTSSEDNVTFDCSIDNKAYEACTSGAHLTGFSDGAHSFAVRAHDRANNLDASPAIYTWVIDTSTPDTQIMTGPSGAVANTNAEFTFLSPNAGPGATFECKLDAAAFAACSSPKTYTNLAAGTHTFAVRVRNSAGTFDPTPAMQTWVVDTAPPTTTITSGPTGTIAMTSASFAFEANEPSTFQCQLDAGAYAACTSPVSFTNLAQGSHTFSVRATDTAGHPDPTPATRTWTVDTTPPDITFTSGPAQGATVGPRVTIAFAVSEGTPTCTLDGAAVTPCTSPVSFNVGAGMHTFRVSAEDAAGNPGSATRSWTTACAAPDAAGAVGLLHLDTNAQDQANATGGAGATLGADAMASTDDPTFVSMARYGGGFDFKSGELIAWPLAAATTTTPTVQLWVKPDKTSTASTVLATGDGRLAIGIAPGGGNNVKITATIDGQTASSAIVPSAEWHHVVVTVVGADLRLYVDGVRTVVAGGAPNTALALDSIQLGGTYLGDLDEVWIGTASAATDDAALGGYCPL